MQLLIVKKMLEKFKNFLKIITIKKDEAIITCLENDIPPTDENIKEVRDILEAKRNVNLSKKQIENIIL